MKARNTILILLSAAVAAAMTGCSTDVDPHQKVDAPGYYNGPMNPKGASGATPGAKATAGTTGAAGTTG